MRDGYSTKSTHFGVRKSFSAASNNNLAKSSNIKLVRVTDLIQFKLMISVITPCINLYDDSRIDYFEKMMKSIHRQTYSNIEHIVVDGGSTDGTLNLLHEYEKKGWVNKLISENDTGIYNAVNSGIKMASGEYIQIMNTDDYFTDLGYFMDAVKVLQESVYDFIHADKLVERKEGGFKHIKVGDESIAFFRMPFRHQTMVVKREVFDSIGLFDETFKIAADYKFVLGMLMAGKKGIHIPKVVLCSRDGGVSSDRKECIEEVTRVLFEAYGQDSGLTLSDCTDIYKRKISLELFEKISKKITNEKVLSSLEVCYQLSQRGF